MLKPGRSMFIAAKSVGDFYSRSPKFYEFIDESSFSLSAYFYNTGDTDNDISYNLSHLRFVRICSFKKQDNQVSVLKEKISPKIPFVKEFFDQNKPGVILSITKKKKKT